MYVNKEEYLFSKLCEFPYSSINLLMASLLESMNDIFYIAYYVVK